MASGADAGTDRPLGFLETPARQAATLREREHRPWPLPEGGWMQGQTWEQLLFAHWRVPIEALRAHRPAELEVDTFDGDAYVGITPFRVTGLRLRGLPPVPLLSSFLEVNCRTYVSLAGERAGIWFFSLHASSQLAVEGARRLYKLPYFRAAMSGPPRFSSIRTEGGEDRVLEASYRPAGEAPHRPSRGRSSTSSPSATASTRRTRAAPSTARRSTIRRGRSRTPTPSSSGSRAAGGPGGRGRAARDVRRAAGRADLAARARGLAFRS